MKKVLQCKIMSPTKRLLFHIKGFSDTIKKFKWIPTAFLFIQFCSFNLSFYALLLSYPYFFPAKLQTTSTDSETEIPALFYYDILFLLHLLLVTWVSPLLCEIRKTVKKNSISFSKTLLNINKTKKLKICIQNVK